jgi:hypothetical protein
MVISDSREGCKRFSNAIVLGDESEQTDTDLPVRCNGMDRCQDSFRGWHLCLDVLAWLLDGDIGTQGPLRTVKDARSRIMGDFVMRDKQSMVWLGMELEAALHFDFEYGVMLDGV